MSLLTAPFTSPRPVLTTHQKNALLAQSSAWSSLLTLAERQAVVDYTQTAYGVLNTSLRAGEAISQMSVLLDSALVKSSGYDKRVVWRGVQYDGGADFSVDDQIDMLAYTSTTANPINATTILNRNAPHQAIYEMTVFNGAPIDALSVKEGREAEVLLPRNSRFVVTEIVTDYRFMVSEVDEVSGYDYDFCAGTVTLIRMEQVL